MPRLMTLFAVVLLSAGCSTFDFRYGEDEAQRLTRKILGPDPDWSEAMPTIALDDQMKRALDERINPRWQGSFKLRELRKFLFSPEEKGIKYEATATRTAAEVWETGTGNCLAMTNLYVAAARYIGLDARYTVVEVTPTWDHSAGTMVRYEHIVATGRLPGGGEYVLDFLPEFVIGENASIHIPDRAALKLYYSNLGAEALLERNPEAALDYLRKALHIDPRFSDGWSNIGAALRRLERYDQAEFAYQRALEIDPGNLSALSNLVQFYVFQEREAESEALMRRVVQYRDRNPYYHFYIARRMFEEGEFETTIDLLQRSIQLKRDEPQFYTALAETYEQIGDDRRVDKYLALAQKHREEPRSRSGSREFGHRFFIRTIEL